MKKIKYLLVRFKSMQWKELRKIVKTISKKTNKNSLLIYLDIFYCILKYGTGYMDYFEFEFYLLNKEERKTYLTSTLNNQIIAKYNDKNYMHIFSDKIEFCNVFKKYINRDFLDLKTSSFEQFKKFIKGKEKIIAKVVDSCGGKGISIYKVSEYKEEDLYNLLKENKQYLLEELIIQNKKMNQLYDGSINSLRIISFLKDDGEVEIMNIVLRIGNGGVVDNFSSGGMYTFLSMEGKILIPAIDEEGKIYKKHPISKEDIVGFQVPNFDEVIKYVKKLAKVEPNIRYVGWDIAVTDKGVDVIEGNEYSGVFQMKPSLSDKKEGLLPKYRKHMDI